MAELNTGDGGGGKKGSKKVRSKKQNSKVDLTAMVDLAFLLITFFMLTTTLSKPQSMSLGLPDKNDSIKTPDVKVDENRTMTILLGDNNKLVRYVGLLATPVKGGAPKDFEYGKDGIRKELLSRKAAVLQYTGTKEKGMIVIIKPSKKSNYRNLVDVLDEMAIVGVPTYAIVNEFSPQEAKLLANGTATPAAEATPNP
jgi:biopolymer transport protein ExbD